MGGCNTPVFSERNVAPRNAQSWAHATAPSSNEDRAGSMRGALSTMPTCAASATSFTARYALACASSITASARKAIRFEPRPGGQ